VFPDEWKRCNVTPIHKGGSTDDPSPISVVLVVAKVLKKVVATQLSLKGINFSALISVPIVGKNQLNNCLWWLLIVLHRYNQP